MPVGPDEEEGDEVEEPPESDAPDEPILAPEELDFTENERVAEIDEGKFVIGTDDRPRVPHEKRPQEPRGAFPRRSVDSGSAERHTDPTQSEPTPGLGDTGSGGPTAPGDLTGREVKAFISTELRRTDSQYAYRIAAKTGPTVSHQQLASDDIGMAFDGLLMWYAQQVSSDTSVEEALGILLAKSNIRIRYPLKLLTAYLREQGLSPDDDIADLLEVIKREEGLVFPPGSQG